MEKVVLYPSEAMDKNTKRDEDKIIRISSNTRADPRINKDLNNQILLKTDPPNEEEVVLNIYKAYSSDLKKLRLRKKQTDTDTIVGFVTTTTFEKFYKALGPNAIAWLAPDITNVVIGCDPEFLIYDKESNEIVSATMLLNNTGNMGSDGALAEIRPPPNEDPELLIQSIISIFRDKNYENIIKNYLLKCSCYVKTKERDYPVGGHLHIGNPSKILNVKFPDREYIFKTFNKILDELLAVPLTKLDNKEDATSRRTNCKMCITGNKGYGFFGEYRLAPKTGPNRRLEYRTLSGMWLLHPMVALGVLGTAKAIVDDLWKKMDDKNYSVEYAYPNKYKTAMIWGNNFAEWNKFGLCKDLNCVTSSEEIIKQLNKPDPEAINKQFLNRWLNKLKKLSTYKKYSTYIELLAEILAINSKELNEWDKIIQNNWLEGNKFIVNL